MAELMITVAAGHQFGGGNGRLGECSGTSPERR